MGKFIIGGYESEAVFRKECKDFGLDADKIIAEKKVDNERSEEGEYLPKFGRFSAKIESVIVFEGKNDDHNKGKHLKTDKSGNPFITASVRFSLIDPEGKGRTGKSSTMFGYMRDGGFDEKTSQFMEAFDIKMKDILAITKNENAWKNKKPAILDKMPKVITDYDRNNGKVEEEFRGYHIGSYDGKNYIETDAVAFYPITYKVKIDEVTHKETNKIFEDFFYEKSNEPKKEGQPGFEEVKPEDLPF